MEKNHCWGFGGVAAQESEFENPETSQEMWWTRYFVPAEPRCISLISYLRALLISLK